ncbi:hypothetical protein BGZ60DRAFT_395463 [Tricladium varicosporioides]|nr:hypothetical protein BGZ60DRAFT_395463 [Hymenoscyphus varicosporioides]
MSVSESAKPTFNTFQLPETPSWTDVPSIIEESSWSIVKRQGRVPVSGVSGVSGISGISGISATTSGITSLKTSSTACSAASCISGTQGGITSSPSQTSSATVSPTSFNNFTDYGQSSGLSGGAKAGIAIGVIAVVAIICGIAFFIWRRRKAGLAAKTSGNQDGLPGMAEMGTPANVHEIGATRGQSVKKSGVVMPPELGGDDQSKKPESTMPPELGVTAEITVSELPAESAIPREGISTPTQKTDSNLPPAEIVFGQFAKPGADETASRVSGSSDNAAGSSQKLDYLKEKMDKIRAEKERLQKLQELDELEAAVQKEIMDEQRKTLGSGS